MKSLREQFEEDYAAVPYTDRPGGKVKIRYVYDAPWYRWNLPESVLKKKKWQMAGASMACLGIFILTALLPSGVNIWSLTAITGVVSLAAHILELFGVIRFMVAKYQVTRTDYNYINSIMKLVPWIHGGCLSAAFLTGIIFQAKTYFEPWSMAACVGYLICAGISFYIAVSYRKIPAALS